MRENWKKGFFTLMAGQAVSYIGSVAVQFSLIWWLASESGSPFTMSLAGLAAFVPVLLLGPFAGVWIDRLKRKTVMICADLFVGLAALGMSFLFMAGRPSYASAFVVLALRAVGGVFHGPAIQAAVPMLVPQDQLVKANGWSQLLQSASFMLGPVLGAALYAAFPLWLILWGDVAGAVAASAAAALVKIPDPPRESVGKQHIFGEMWQGALALLGDRKLLVVTVASVAAMVLYCPLASYYPLMSSDHFAASAWHAGAVELLYAAGMMLAAFAFSRAGPIKNKLAVVHGGLFGLGAVSLVCGALPRDMALFWVFAAACFAMGAAGNVYNVPYVAYLQQTVPPEKMGRVFSLIGSLSSLAMPLGLLIAGPVAEKGGVALWFLIAGAGVCLIALASAAVVRRVIL